VDIIHTHLLKQVHQVTEADLTELAREKFPSQQLKKLQLCRNNLMQVMRQNMEHLFQMGKYMKRETAKEVRRAA